MIAVLERGDSWVGPSFLTRMDYDRAIRLDQQFSIESECALLRVQVEVRSKIG